MNVTLYDDLSEQVNKLSFDERLKLIELIIGTLQIEEKKSSKTDSAAFDKAFGMWSGKNVSIESIREKAWRR
jgi:hypothetical protein